ncbi:MAG: hypothetical protein AB7C95_00985 [Synergistaceae bacterium]
MAFTAEVTKELIKAALVYGVPAVLDLIDSWDDAEPTVEELQARLEALPKAEDAFPGEVPPEG